MSDNPSEKAPKKKIIMRSDIATTEIGKAFLSQFEVRFGPGLQADIILPGPPLSWAFTMIENVNPGNIMGVASRLDRMVQMFQHAIVVCISPTPEGFWKLQQHLSEAGPKHLGTKLLMFPDHKSAASSVLGMCPMLMDAARRRGQQKFVAQLRAEIYSGPSAVLGFLIELILSSGDTSTADQDDSAHKDAQLLWERFGTLAQLFTFGAGKTHSFYALQCECPIEDSTAGALDEFFEIESASPTTLGYGDSENMHQDLLPDFEGSFSNMRRESDEYSHQGFGFEMNHTPSFELPHDSDVDVEIYGHSGLASPCIEDDRYVGNNGSDTPFAPGIDGSDNGGAYMYAPPGMSSNPYGRSYGAQKNDGALKQLNTNQMDINESFTFGGGEYSYPQTDAEYQAECAQSEYLSEEQRPIGMHFQSQGNNQNAQPLQQRWRYGRNRNPYAW